MVFGGEHDGDIDRYSTWEEAEKGHQEMCEVVFNPYTSHRKNYE